MQIIHNITIGAFPSAWNSATSTVVNESEIGFMLGLTILSISHTVHRAVGIITQPGSRSNTSFKRTRTGGADVRVFWLSAPPVRAA